MPPLCSPRQTERQHGCRTPDTLFEAAAQAFRFAAALLVLEALRLLVARDARSRSRLGRADGITKKLFQASQGAIAIGELAPLSLRCNP